MSIRGTLSPRSFRDRRARFHPGRIELPFAHHQRIARTRHRPLTHGLLLVIISIAVGYATITQGGFPGRSRAFAAPVTGLSLPGVSSSVPLQNATVLHALVVNKTIPTQQVIPQKQQEEAAQFAAASATPTAEAPQEDAVVRAASVASPPDLPPYRVYKVEEGDTVSTIAARNNIDPAYILANNADLHDGNLLTLGQSIIIPAGNGILHEVRYGETLSDIAARYGVDEAAITDFRANDIASADRIAEAQLVFVPNAVVQVAPAAAEAPADASAPEQAAAPEDTGGGAAGAPSGIVAGGPNSSAGLIWPVSGPISSYYGAGHPLGIDIDGFNLAGAAVAAATSGTVVFAGGNACCSYGLYVVVVSPGGIETLYGHLSSISVVQGQEVAQGEALGVIGSTGYSTGRHLHFEVIDNGVRENPLSYLP